MPDFRVERFEGGITDDYRNGAPNTSRYLNNFLINKNGKPFQRPGMDVIGKPQFSTDRPITGQYTWLGNLFEVGNRELKRRNDNTGSSVPVNEFGSPNEALSSGSDYDSVSFHEWRDHLYIKNSSYSRPSKMYYDPLAFTYNVTNSGLPAIAGNPIASGTAGANNYIYAFAYFWEYQIGDVTFLDAGPVKEYQITNVNAPDVNVINVSLWSWPTNGTDNNWDLANLKVRIYRTEAGGTVRKFVGEKAYPDITAFADTTADTALGAAIYTTGGVSENIPIPECKFMTITGDVAWYGAIKDATSGDERPFEVRQAIPLDPDSSPEDYIIQIDESLTGMSHIDVYPIVFALEKTYRFEGQIDRFGRGTVRKRVVSSTVGCISNDSIIQVERGLYFAAKDGFYFTDGFQVQKLSEHITARYKTFVQTDAQMAMVKGTHDLDTGRIYWAMASNAEADIADIENDTIFVLDPYWGKSPKSCFTSFESSSDLQVSCLSFVEGELFYGEKRGYTMRLDAARDNDYYIESGQFPADPSFWLEKPVPYLLESNAYSFGSETVRKLATKLVPSVRKFSDKLAVDIQSINDDSGIEKAMKPINLDNSDRKIILTERRFPSKQMRCTYKQIIMRPATVALHSTDVSGLGRATTQNGGGSLTLIKLDNYTPMIIEWPGPYTPEFLEYTLHLDVDDYQTAYDIVAHDAQYITFSEPFVSAYTSVKWEIRGLIHDQNLEVQGYTIIYQPFGTGQAEYGHGGDGGNYT